MIREYLKRVAILLIITTIVYVLVVTAKTIACTIDPSCSISFIRHHHVNNESTR